VGIIGNRKKLKTRFANRSSHAATLSSSRLLVPIPEHRPGAKAFVPKSRRVSVGYFVGWRCILNASARMPM
jgi:hypothetical protein